MSKGSTYREMIDAMPGRIRNRFLSLAKYTDEIVNEYQQIHGIPKRKRLRRDSIQIIQIAVFTFVLKRFFEDGARAAEYAVRAFKEIDVDGFTVGETLFSGDNENVRMGRTLSEKLEDAMHRTALWDAITSACSINSLVNNLTEEVLKHA